MAQTTPAPMSRRESCEHLVRRIHEQGAVSWRDPSQGVNNICPLDRVRWVGECFRDLGQLLFYSPLGAVSDDSWRSVSCEFSTGAELSETGFGTNEIRWVGDKMKVTIYIYTKLLGTLRWKNNALIALLHQMVHAYFVLACSYRGDYDEKGVGHEVEHDMAFCVLLEAIDSHLNTDFRHDDLVYCKPVFSYGGSRSDLRIERPKTCNFRSISRTLVDPVELRKWRRKVERGYRLPKALLARRTVPSDVSGRVHTEDTESVDREETQDGQRPALANPQREPAESQGLSRDEGKKDRSHHKYNDLESHSPAAESGTPESSWSSNKSSEARARRRRRSYEDRRAGKLPARQPQQATVSSVSSLSTDDDPYRWPPKPEVGESSGYRPCGGRTANQPDSPLTPSEPFSEDSVGMPNNSSRPSYGMPANAPFEQEESISPRTPMVRDSLLDMPPRRPTKSQRQAPENPKPTRSVSDPADYARGRAGRPEARRPQQQPLRDDPVREPPPHQPRRQASEPRPAYQRRRFSALFGQPERPTNIEGRRNQRRRRFSDLFAARVRPESPVESPPPPAPAPVERRNRSPRRGRRESVAAPEEQAPVGGLRVHRRSRHRIRVRDREEEWVDEDDGRGHCAHRHQKRRSASSRRQRAHDHPGYPVDSEVSATTAGRSDSLSHFSEQPDVGKGWKVWRRWRAEKHSKRTRERQMRDCEMCAERRERRRSRGRSPSFFNAAKGVLSKK